MKLHPLLICILLTLLSCLDIAEAIQYRSLDRALWR